MIKPHTPSIRALLRENPDGLTAIQITKALGISKGATTRRCLESMPDTYIDRWVNPVRGQWQAVWCIVVPPANCPRPSSDTVTARTRWVNVLQGQA